MQFPVRYWSWFGRCVLTNFPGSWRVQQPWNLLPLHHWHPHTLRSQKDDRKSRQDSQVWLECWRNKVDWLPWPVKNLNLWFDDFQHCWTRSVWEEVPLISKRGGHRVNLFIKKVIFMGNFIFYKFGHLYGRYRCFTWLLYGTWARIWIISNTFLLGKVL